MQIVALYDQLALLTPGPVVHLNRAVAVSLVDGPAAGLQVVDDITGLDGYRPLHSLPANLLTRLGRLDKAREQRQRARP